MSFAAVINQSWQHNRLFSALLELTYRCNLDCFFCYNDLGLRGRHMRAPDYRRLLDDLADMGTLNVILSGGEPLAHPEFFAIGTHARERGFLVRVKSNGHALGPRLATRLRDEVDPFLVEVSLHGADGPTHDRQTRVKGSFDRLMKNLETLNDLGIRVRINSTLTRWNEHQVADMFAIADARGLQLQFDPEVSPRDDGDWSPLNIAPSEDGLRRLYALQMERGRRQAPASPVRMAAALAPLPAEQRTDKHCGAGSSVIAVDPFGNVYPCVQYRQPIGNLHQSAIAAIWGDDNPALRELREMQPGFRRLALEQGISGFCPGMAHAVSGDAMQVPASVRRRQEIQDALSDERVGVSG